MSRSILIVEDEALLAKNIKVFLSRQGFDARTASGGEDGWRQWERDRPDLVLLDYRLGDTDGLDVLRRIRGDDPQALVVLMTGSDDVRVAVEAMKAGAADYLGKPLVLDELKPLLDRLVDQARIAGALCYYQSREAGHAGLQKQLGESPPMRSLRQRLRLVIDAERRLVDGETPPAVLITGETGTGKELVARALHFDGLRRDKPFIELNCAALPSQLIEAELFGYERGAFTDAKSRKPGLAETADGGTLFLDEIGELAPTLQAKLLRLLEYKRVRRIGAVSDRPVDVRIVAATNQNLDERVRLGHFRADLLFRLRIVHLELPPLRRRGDDVLLLAQEFLDFHGRRYGKAGLTLSSATRALLCRHDWPGNVRELRNLIEQAVLLLADGQVIEPQHLALNPIMTKAGDGAGAPAGGDTADGGQELRLERLELRAIGRALDQTGWNVTQAAQLLGISRDALRYRMEKYGLHGSGGAGG